MEFILMMAVLGGICYGFFAVTSSIFGWNKVSSLAGFSPVKLLMKLAGLDGWKKNEGARFLPDRALKKVLNQNNKGLLIDGKNLRLSDEDSFTHNMIVAPTGAGKSTRYVIPNVLTLDDCSMVITDPSGELFKKTAGHLQSKGYDIQVLAPADPGHSMRYNPLDGIRDYSQIMEIAQTLVRSSNPSASSGDQFWYDGAASLIAVLIRCLAAAGKEFCNLGNVLYLLQNFEGDGRGLAKFIDKYADNAAYNQFKGIVTGNEKTTQGFVSTAVTSLTSLNSPEMAALLSENEIRFADLREKKTALFLILPSNKLKHYSFLMNLFYVDLFDSLMQKIPSNVRAEGKKCLPVYCLMDEFGHTALPDFATTCSVIRKYEVSFSIILQNFSQLYTNYEKTEAETIIEGGMQSRVFYPGLSINTAQEVEAMLGKEVVRSLRWNGTTEKKEQNLLNADRIRTLPKDQAIFLTSNKEAMLLETLPCYRHKVFARRMQRPYKGKIHNRRLPEFKRVPLS